MQLQRRKTQRNPKAGSHGISNRSLESSEDYKLKVIDEIFSPINGILLVTTNPILGLNVINDKKIAMSGDTVAKVLSNGLIYVMKSKPGIKNCLILGYGVGKIGQHIHQLFPDVKVTGIEIDQEMVSIGKKYFEIEPGDDEIIIADAYKQCAKFKTDKRKFNLIIVDVFIGDLIPERFEKRKFGKLLQSLLTTKGSVIFNRLYSEKYKNRSDNFINTVTEVFKNVKTIIYKNNLLIICQI